MALDKSKEMNKVIIAHAQGTEMQQSIQQQSKHSLKTTNVNLLMALEEKLKNHQRDSSSGNHDYLSQISWQSINKTKGWT